MPVLINDSNKNDALLPIVIGVTGQRDLRPEDIPVLEMSVRKLFDEWKRLYPNSPFQIISPLAEGADRLVARIGLEEVYGFQLIVPLPFEAVECQKDFNTVDSQEEFDRLLLQTTKSFSLPLAPGCTLADIAKKPECRNLHYARAGAYVVKNCNLLLALWDGKFMQKTGGTSDVVQYKTNGLPEELLTRYHLLDHTEKSPIYHILTPRLSNHNPGGTTGEIRVIMPEKVGNSDHAIVVFEETLKRIDIFNRDIHQYLPGLIPEYDKNRQYLFPGQDAENFSLDLQEIRNQYGAADTLANRFKNRRIKVIKGVLVTVITGVFFFTAHEYFAESLFHGHEWTTLLLIMYPVLLLVAYFVTRIADRKRYHDKHLDYRAIAEGLRVLYFWRLIGINDSPSDHYLSKHAGVLSWIRVVLRNCEVGTTVNQTRTNPQTSVGLVLKYWIRGQRDFYRRAHLRDHKKYQQQQTKVNVFFGTSMAIAITMILLHGWLLAHHLLEFGGFSICFFLALAASLNGYADKIVWDEESKQYLRMEELYTRGLEFIEKKTGLAWEKTAKKYVSVEGLTNDHKATQELKGPSNSHEDAIKMIKILGLESLAEQGDWVILHRSKTIEVPKG